MSCNSGSQWCPTPDMNQYELVIRAIKDLEEALEDGFEATGAGLSRKIRSARYSNWYIPYEIARKLQRCSGLRNRLVHDDGVESINKEAFIGLFLSAKGDLLALRSEKYDEEAAAAEVRPSDVGLGSASKKEAMAAGTNQYELAVRTTKYLEKMLREEFEAVGDGLSRKVATATCADWELPHQLRGDLIRFSRARNRIIHGHARWIQGKRFLRQFRSLVGALETLVKGKYIDYL